MPNVTANKCMQKINEYNYQLALAHAAACSVTNNNLATKIHSVDNCSPHMTSVTSLASIGFSVLFQLKPSSLAIFHSHCLSSTFEADMRPEIQEQLNFYLLTCSLQFDVRVLCNVP